jgi:hypothetical protein
MSPSLGKRNRQQTAHQAAADDRVLAVREGSAIHSQSKSLYW